MPVRCSVASPGRSTSVPATIRGELERPSKFELDAMKIALYILAGIVIAALGLIVLYRKRKLAQIEETRRWEEALRRAHLDE